MRGRRLAGWVVASLGAVALIAACGLNPQPEPPGETLGGGGAAGSSGEGAGAGGGGPPQGGAGGGADFVDAGGDALDDDAAALGGSDASPEGATDAGCPAVGDELLAKQCAQIAALPCVTPGDPSECEKALAEDQVHVPAACACAFAGLSACAAEHGFACPVYRSDLHVSADCAVAQDAYEACLGKGDLCSGGGAMTDGGAELWIECDRYGAKCVNPGGGAPYTCTCGFGPKVGDTFTAASLGAAELEAAAKVACE